MRFSLFILSMLAIGCSEPVTEVNRALATKTSGNPAGASAKATPAEPKAVPIESGVATIGPENSKITFVGTHVGDEPNPRTGGFAKFSGRIEVAPETQAPKSISVEIDTGSLFTPIGRLTNHLKSPDFFNVREHPTATFESTKIAAAGDGDEVTVTGDLTILGAKKEIEFPATFAIADDGMTLKSEFAIDRTDFGMNWGPERVENEVSLSVTVGEKTTPIVAEGGGPGGGGRGGGRGLGPAALFKARDANEDGKLAGDEISDRMRENLGAFDTDGDGEITREEFDARMRQFRSGRGGRPKKAGKGTEQPKRPESG